MLIRLAAIVLGVASAFATNATGPSSIYTVKGENKEKLEGFTINLPATWRVKRLGWSGCWVSPGGIELEVMRMPSSVTKATHANGYAEIRKKHPEEVTDFKTPGHKGAMLVISRRPGPYPRVSLVSVELRGARDLIMAHGTKMSAYTNAEIAEIKGALLSLKAKD